MSTNLTTLRYYANSLTLADIVDKKTKELLPITDLIVKLQQLQQSYFSSDYYNQATLLRMQKSQTANTARHEREKRREAWCKNNLQVGDIVNVTGTKTNSIRFISYLKPHDFDNYQMVGGPTGRTNAKGASTMYGKVTHLWNKTSSRWEAIDSLLNTVRSGTTANEVLPLNGTSKDSWKFPGQPG